MMKQFLRLILTPLGPVNCTQIANVAEVHIAFLPLAELVRTDI